MNINLFYNNYMLNTLKLNTPSIQNGHPQDEDINNIAGIQSPMGSRNILAKCNISQNRPFLEDSLDNDTERLKKFYSE